MSYSELIGDFGNQHVIDFEGAETWKGPTSAYRLREEYEDETSIADRLDKLLEQPGADQLKSLIIGAWSGSCEGGDSGEIIAKLVDVAPRLPKLRSLFLGELTYEECEISWIKQADVTPILQAYRKLEELRIRGGEGLSFSRIQHDSLRSLAIKTGGLSRTTLRELFLCELPALEHLELLLGESNYGFDGTAEDLQPVLSGRLYPRLKFLGLMNSEIANDLAAVVVNSPIVDRIETLDLSMGNLDDAGVRSLRSLADGHNLKRLNISHHFASDEAVTELQELLPCEVIAADRQEPDDEWRPIVHAE